MTTPKDTWISVKDAMPPIETPERNKMAKFIIIGKYLIRLLNHKNK